MIKILFILRETQNEIEKKSLENKFQFFMREEDIGEKKKSEEK
jgi:hypothetical protein